MCAQICQPPPPLQPGDVLYAVAPSGALKEYERFWAGVEVWRSRGYQIKLAPGYEQRWGYLAGSDAQRRQQLTHALTDPICKGVLCVRGGYGGTRLLEDWSWPEAALAPTPKWLIGFSDITSLLWSLSIHQVSGLHGPVLTTLAQEPSWSLERLFGWIEGNPLPPLQGKSWTGGRVTAPLFPANLTVATYLLGTPHQPDLEGAILALEDVSEAPYRIDRMLTQWRMLGLLERLAGVAIGRFSQCDPPPHTPSLAVDEVLRDRLSGLSIPIVADLPFGHDGPNAVLPVGVMACLDADAGTLSL